MVSKLNLMFPYFSGPREARLGADYVEKGTEERKLLVIWVYKCISAAVILEECLFIAADIIEDVR